MDEKPFKARYRTGLSSGGARVVIPARRNAFTILFLCAWLGGWYFGETSAIKEVLNPKTGQAQGFLLFWLVGWTLGGLWALVCVLWQLVGSEVLEATSSALRHRVEFAGIGFTRNYSTNEIRDLRVSSVNQDDRSAQQEYFPPLFGRGYGLISFDYGARTLRIGSSLDEAEAKGVIEFLRPRLPSSKLTL